MRLHIKILPLLFLFFILNNFGFSYAQHDKSRGFEAVLALNAEVLEIKNDHLLSSFLSASIVKEFGRPDSYKGYLPITSYLSKNSREHFERESIKKLYPWLEPLLFPMNSSKALSLYKWETPVVVSTRFPNDMEPYHEDNQVKINLFGSGGGRNAWEYEDKLSELRNYTNESSKEMEVLSLSVKKFNDAERYVAEELQKSLSKINEYIDISYAASSEVSKDVNLVIVLMKDRSEWKEFGRRSSSGNSYNDGIKRFGFYRNIDEYIYNAVSFTPNLEKQVDGFFVPNDKGEIQFAVCYLWYGHNIEKLRLAVNECLVRSLGFPGVAIHIPNSILYPWNHEFDQNEILDLNVLLEKSEGLLPADEFFIDVLYSESISKNSTYLDIIDKFSME